MKYKKYYDIKAKKWVYFLFCTGIQVAKKFPSLSNSQLELIGTILNIIKSVLTFLSLFLLAWGEVEVGDLLTSYSTWD